MYSTSNGEDMLCRLRTKKILHTDILIIGGGTAGCYAALDDSQNSPIIRLSLQRKPISKEAAVLQPE